MLQSRQSLQITNRPIHKSKGALLQFQDSLPQLPVPTLEKTAKQYVKSLHPLLSAEQYLASKAAVEDFIKPGGVGRALQARLLARRDNPEIQNWLNDWWNETAYLGNREPVVPYTSYFCSYRDDHLVGNPAKRAAAITFAALEFQGLVDSSSLEPELTKGQPLCMAGYKWLYNATRMPARPSDIPVKFKADEHKHIIVVRKNQFFLIPHTLDGKQLSAVELERQFNRVYQLASTQAQAQVPAVGALTSANRDTWADTRGLLHSHSHPTNKEALRVIESASFLVCLDEAAPVKLESRARQYWHGDGANRWYDKPVQFIVNENGTAGFMGEHCMVDGTLALQLNEYINARILSGLEFDAAGGRLDMPVPRRVQFEVTGQVQVQIARAVAEFHSVMTRHNLAVLAYKGYGRALVKKLQCSPDAYVQMLIQLAYFKMHGKIVPTYESASTRRFQLGRTETCRSVLDESVACAAASMGKGVDRHLFGLRKVLRPDKEIPVSSEFFNGYGWAQAVDDGFGVAYMINENWLNFNIVSKGPDCDRMRYYLREAAEEMHYLLKETIAPEVKL
ncbi:choline/carnitine O-acyltransferase [Aspergillus mulundensis]|uniref:Carnitine O-acetyltransferase, mitochondrial n=1 Tax=Aspergillus mulundensis TaxID=1810919 RepID=A0A3D8SD10_9EURO|nr:Choline o-acyltransferase [Aspergillus mulundensis]RDW84199.1 Choline o-acyltransferase [Aspergillus mulundensis]